MTIGTGRTDDRSPVQLGRHHNNGDTLLEAKVGSPYPMVLRVTLTDWKDEDPSPQKVAMGAAHETLTLEGRGEERVCLVRRL